MGADGRQETPGSETTDGLLPTAVLEPHHLALGSYRFLRARGDQAPVLTGQWARTRCAGLCCWKKDLGLGTPNPVQEIVCLPRPPPPS